MQTQKFISWLKSGTNTVIVLVYYQASSHSFIMISAHMHQILGAQHNIGT